MKEIFYNIVHEITKQKSIIYGHYDKYLNSDHELNKYVLDILLNSPNIVFTIAKIPIEAIEIKDKKETLFVETKIFTFKEFIKYIENIEENTIFGLHELYAYSADKIEIRFYEKNVSEDVIGVI